MHTKFNTAGTVREAVAYVAALTTVRRLPVTLAGPMPALRAYCADCERTVVITRGHCDCGSASWTPAGRRAA